MVTTPGSSGPEGRLRVRRAVTSFSASAGVGCLAASSGGMSLVTTLSITLRQRRIDLRPASSSLIEARSRSPLCFSGEWHLTQ